MARTRNLAHVQAQRARDRFNLTLEEQPLVLGAIGIAVGAAICQTLSYLCSITWFSVFPLTGELDSLGMRIRDSVRYLDWNR